MERVGKSGAHTIWCRRRDWNKARFRSHESLEWFPRNIRAAEFYIHLGLWPYPRLRQGGFGRRRSAGRPLMPSHPVRWHSQVAPRGSVLNATHHGRGGGGKNVPFQAPLCPPASSDLASAELHDTYFDKGGGTSEGKAPCGAS